MDRSLKKAELTAKVEVEGTAENVAASTVSVSVSLDGELKGSEEVQVINGEAAVTFHIQDSQLWYPVGYGDQPLYQLNATLLTSNSSGIELELDTCQKRLGLRRAELIQRDLIDSTCTCSEGKTFLFEINNIPIFCGGSNWIPADSFIPSIKAERYRSWLRLVADGNQVMVRVWGGGLFEEKAFYDACDEFGILVWHDFLFGCGNYPAYPEFLHLVEREARANVKRLRHHPSIVIWAGNNEDYQYCESENLEWNPDDKNPENWLKSTFPARYIYEKILVDVTRELVPDTYYHFSSPWGGKDTKDPTVGDIHQWNGKFVYHVKRKVSVQLYVVWNLTFGTSLARNPRKIPGL